MLRGRADKFCLHLNWKWTGKIHFNEIIKKKKYGCINYFQSCTSVWNTSLKKLAFCFCNELAPVLHLRTALPSVLLYSDQHTDQHKRLPFFCEFQLEEFNNSTLFETNVWKIFHFDVLCMRTVSICVFQVMYDGREIPCDYTEPVLSRCLRQIKILQWRQNLSAHLRTHYVIVNNSCGTPFL